MPSVAPRIPFRALLLALIALAAGTSTTAAAPAPETSRAAPRGDDEKRPALEQYNLDKRGLALAGYDPVAYFPEGGGKPLEGKPELAFTLKGVTYRFASEANRERFRAAPARFEPAYGGWCAYAMADGKKVGIDPKSFLIEDGRLLVFYKSFFNDTRKSWKKEGAAKLRPKADTAWKKFLVTPPPKQD